MTMDTPAYDSRADACGPGSTGHRPTDDPQWQAAVTAAQQVVDAGTGGESVIADALVAALGELGDRLLPAGVLVDVERWKVDLPDGAVKGISRDDAVALARQHGGTVSRSRVRLYAGGKEVLDPWVRVPLAEETP